MGYLPNRRESDIIEFPWPADIPVYTVRVQLSKNEDGDICESFVNLFKAGSVKEFDNDIAEGLKDFARMLSLELQDGTPIAAVATRTRRGDKGEAISLIGGVVDALCAEQYN